MGESEGKEDSIGYALDRCIDENLLADYFENLKREDRGMIFGEYSREDDIEVQRREAAEDNAIANARNFLMLNKLTTEEIARCCSLPLEQVIELAEELSLAPVAH